MLAKGPFTLIAALVLASASTAFAQSDRQNTVAPNSNQYSQGYVGPWAQNCNVAYKGFPLCDWYDSYLH
jgi:hypothetical protein